MQVINLSDLLLLCLHHNLPFYSYRMPNSSDIITGIQLNNDFSPFASTSGFADGFVVAPFAKESRANSYFIRADIQFINRHISEEDYQRLLRTSLTVTDRTFSTPTVTKEEYLEQANALINKLKNRDLSKVVLSRTMVESGHSIENAPHYFLNLAARYFTAFVSFFHIPGTATWMGATPETLLKQHGNQLQTMSLAGTKSLNKESVWTEKEREEQQMVSDYIEQILHKQGFEQIAVDGPQNHIAGNVMHLMTKYDCTGTLSHQQLLDLIATLHPTPAVCGLPTEEALALIAKTEQHDREYYAGYLGPVSSNGCDLFVNLRCMKWSQNAITLFVGGGITAQSDAEKEWQETCLKSETLLKGIKD